jgi:aromatic-L-amino-acid decarboxylase
VPTLADICADEGLWLHVDAAYAGPAALCPELRPLFAGVDRADSYCFNAHKWMLTNFDCTCYYVADRGPLLRTLSILPEYLKNQATASGAVIDYRDWQVPLGRRFRALKLWMVIRHYGAQGLRRHIRRHVAWAARLATQVTAHPDFELAAPNPLSLVCFRHRGGEAVNRGILDALNASGRLYLTHTKVDGLYTLRLAIGGAQTEWRHVEGAWLAIVEEAARQTP